ncbi:uncharacterized protein LDX57_003333 [Aspergillus melleus]|uniref:uncharacterized protein n=1 Tax=Aspergillus melleus TaxID=138277 RepID=UPI001E8DC635|nr:uncharacterized protein LDX57_003333 [Aspergillus melleus]KAH8425583.1 hypothetical protein LDX57_003333 [Aspergillus melleus]
MYSGLHVGQRFGSLEEFKALVRSISVRQHWELRVTRSNKKSVVIGCRSSANCFFRVVCRANKNATYISSLQDSHSCRRNATSTPKTPVRSEVSHVRFLLTEIPKLFDMRNNIKAQEVVDAVKRYHGYEISTRQAQRALIRLEQQQSQTQEERANTLDSSGDDQPDLQAASEEQAEGSTYSGLSGQRWLPDSIQNSLMEPSNPDLQASQLPGETLQPHHPHIQHQHHSVQHPSGLHSQGQPSPGFSVHHHPTATSHQSAFGVPTSNQPSTPQTAHPKPQRRYSSGGHPAAAQLVLTNFKIEFTCTTCGALNQSFFPNHGNVTGGNYLPQHAVSNTAGAADVAGPPRETVPGNAGHERVDDTHGFGVDTTGGARGVQSSPWAPGSLEVPMPSAHS